MGKELGLAGGKKKRKPERILVLSQLNVWGAVEAPVGKEDSIERGRTPVLLMVGKSPVKFWIIGKKFGVGKLRDCIIFTYTENESRVRNIGRKMAHEDTSPETSFHEKD